MTRAISSAQPISLYRYANTGFSINSELVAEANHLASVLYHFESTCTEYRVHVSYLADDLRNYCRRVEDVDRWVRNVGLGFERADAGWFIWGPVAGGGISGAATAVAGPLGGIFAGWLVGNNEEARNPFSWLDAHVFHPVAKHIGEGIESSLNWIEEHRDAVAREAAITAAGASTIATGVMKASIVGTASVVGGPVGGILADWAVNNGEDTENSISWLDAHVFHPVAKSIGEGIESSWNWIRGHRDTVAMGAAIVAAGTVTIATGGAAAPLLVAAIGATAAGGTTIAINWASSQPLMDGVVKNTVAGGVLGLGIGYLGGAELAKSLGGGLTSGGADLMYQELSNVYNRRPLTHIDMKELAGSAVAGVVTAGMLGKNPGLLRHVAASVESGQLVPLFRSGFDPSQAGRFGFLDPLVVGADVALGAGFHLRSAEIGRLKRLHYNKVLAHISMTSVNLDEEGNILVAEQELKIIQPGWDQHSSFVRALDALDHNQFAKKLAKKLGKKLILQPWRPVLPQNPVAVGAGAP